MIHESAHHGFGDTSTGPGEDVLEGLHRGRVERRAYRRARTLVVSKIVIADGLADCVVRNLSIRGAQVRVLGDVELPPAFGLLMTSKGLLFDATVVWRNGDKLGLTFCGRHDLHADTDPTDTPGTRT